MLQLNILRRWRNIKAYIVLGMRREKVIAMIHEDDEKDYHDVKKEKTKRKEGLSLKSRTCYMSSRGSSTDQLMDHNLNISIFIL